MVLSRLSHFLKQPASEAFLIEARMVEFDISVELWPIVEARTKDLDLTPEEF
jgi:hypothetical protein